MLVSTLYSNLPNAVGTLSDDAIASEADAFVYPVKVVYWVFNLLSVL